MSESTRQEQKDKFIAALRGSGCNVRKVNAHQVLAEVFPEHRCRWGRNGQCDGQCESKGCVYTRAAED